MIVVRFALEGLHLFTVVVYTYTYCHCIILIHQFCDLSNHNIQVELFILNSAYDPLFMQVYLGNGNFKTQ